MTEETLFELALNTPAADRAAKVKSSLLPSMPVRVSVSGPSFSPSAPLRTTDTSSHSLVW